VGSIRQSLVYSLADNYLGMALQLVVSLVIARLLTPAELGIFSVAAVFAALAATFRDFGVADYLVQEKELTPAKIRAAFAVSLMISWLIAAAMYAASGPVADFYRQPGIAEVMKIQCLSFLLIPIGAVAMAYHRRLLNYRPLFIASLLSNVTSLVVAITAAFAGLSYLSLAWSSVAGVAVTVAVSLYFRPKGLPRWPSLTGLGDIFHFGKHASGIYLVGQIGKTAPEAVIGRVLDMASVAFFARASGLMELFNRSILRAVSRVCLPYFSQSARAGHGTQEAYLKAVSLITGIGWPFFIFVGVAAYPVIRLLFGHQWTESVMLAQILCLAAVLELPYYLATEVMVSVGRIDQSNRLQFFVQTIRISSLALVFPFGLPGACWGLVGSTLIGTIIAQRFLHRIIGLRFLDLARVCAPSVIVAALSVAPIIALTLVIEPSGPSYPMFLLIGSLATGTAWLGALYVSRHPVWPELVRAASSMRRGKRAN
jgi:O-antigen/teichoic acid export membrane protein